MIKSLIRNSLSAVGLELRRTRPRAAPGSSERPIGNLKSFLEDVKARNFSPLGMLDVGANRGDWARLALSVFRCCKEVILIEPLNEMEHHLRGLCSEYPFCQYVKAAAGRSAGNLVQTIYEDEDLVGASFLPATDHGQLADGRQRLTRGVTIDELLAKNTGFRPDLVKLDIQGFEIEALSGGTKLFGITELFIVETLAFSFWAGQPITREIIGFMAERGYEIYDVVDYIRRPYDGALGSVDIAFVRRDGFLRASNRWD